MAQANLKMRLKPHKGILAWYYETTYFDWLGEVIVNFSNRNMKHCK